jgi:hypothetical protein
MAWVRIHDGALQHRKVCGMLDTRRPFDLWVWGLSYCQNQLTDGLIHLDTLPKHTDKAQAALVERGLWERHDVGFKVHDYLDWNDCRDLVKARQTKAKDRQRRWYERANGVPNADPNVVPNAVRNGVTNGVPNGEPNQTKPNKKEKNVRAAAPPDPRVKVFLEWFKSEYALERAGAIYLIKWQRDTVLVKEMLRNTDLETLQDMARILLTDNTNETNKFIPETDRGIQILSNQFTWLSNRLSAWKVRQNRAV